MSLDVYLKLDGAPQSVFETGAIFIRDKGEQKQITRAEWDEKFPSLEPMTVDYIHEYVYDANITHNLAKMAGQAGIYEHLWRPDEIGVERAEQLIEPLQAGLELLQSDPDRFKTFNPGNKWGDYDGLVRFVEKYLEACREYPDASVEVSR